MMNNNLSVYQHPVITPSCLNCSGNLNEREKIYNNLQDLIIALSYTNLNFRELFQSNKIEWPKGDFTQEYPTTGLTNSGEIFFTTIFTNKNIQQAIIDAVKENPEQYSYRPQQNIGEGPSYNQQEDSNLFKNAINNIFDNINKNPNFMANSKRTFGANLTSERRSQIKTFLKNLDETITYIKKIENLYQAKNQLKEMWPGLPDKYYEEAYFSLWVHTANIQNNVPQPLTLEDFNSKLKSCFSSYITLLNNQEPLNDNNRKYLYCVEYLLPNNKQIMTYRESRDSENLVFVDIKPLINSDDKTIREIGFWILNNQVSNWKNYNHSSVSRDYSAERMGEHSKFAQAYDQKNLSNLPDLIKSDILQKDLLPMYLNNSAENITYDLFDEDQKWPAGRFDFELQEIYIGFKDSAELKTFLQLEGFSNEEIDQKIQSIKKKVPGYKEGKDILEYNLPLESKSKQLILDPEALHILYGINQKTDSLKNFRDNQYWKNAKYFPKNKIGQTLISLLSFNPIPDSQNKQLARTECDIRDDLTRQLELFFKTYGTKLEEQNKTIYQYKNIKLEFLGNNYFIHGARGGSNIPTYRLYLDDKEIINLESHDDVDKTLMKVFNKFGLTFNLDDKNKWNEISGQNIYPYAKRNEKSLA